MPMTWRVSILAVLAAATVLSACSSSAPSGSPATTNASSTTTTTTSSSVAGSAAASTGADASAIKSAYIKFFDPSTSLADSIALIQDGAEFKDTLVAQGNSSNAKGASVTVSKVAQTSSNQATVTFSILQNGTVLLPDQTGYAVRENGSWKVSGATFCALISIQGSPPPICAKPAATSLPG